MMPLCSCPTPGQEAGHVDEGDDGDVETVAEAHEAGGLDRGVDVEDPGQDLGLVGHDADTAPVQPGEPDQDVLGVVFMNLEEFTLVDDHAG